MAMAAAQQHVPEELIEDIFSRVPAKSLLRFKTASKNWYSLISQDHKFANFHLKRSSKNHHHLVFFESYVHEIMFHSLIIETNESHNINFPFENLFEIGYELIGSANGLICFNLSYEGGFFIWNTCTGEYKKIHVPLRTTGSIIFGFGYDSSSDDYKVVGDWDEHFRIYSLKTNSWKVFKYSFEVKDNAFHWNGALHFCLDEKIAVFDLATEEFSYIELLEEKKTFKGFYLCRPLPASFFVCQDLLCLSGGSSVWVMKKYGDPTSWVRLNIILDQQTPIGMSTLGEVVYHAKDGYGWLKSDTRGRVFKDDKSRMIAHILTQSAFLYTESLISPGCFDSKTKTIRRRRRPRKQRKTTSTY